MSEMSPLHESALFHRKSAINDAAADQDADGPPPKRQKRLELSGVACKQCGCKQLEEVGEDESPEEQEVEEEINVVDNEGDSISRLATMVTRCGEEVLHHPSVTQNGTKTTTESSAAPSSSGVRELAKWQIIEDRGLGFNRPSSSSTLGADRRRRTSGDQTLDPKSKRGRVTIQTDDGPKNVRIIPTKAEQLKDSGKYRCPIKECPYHTRAGSRVYISKHFTNKHKDYRSWRDVFVNANAPKIIQVDEADAEAASSGASLSPTPPPSSPEADDNNVSAANPSVSSVVDGMPPPATQTSSMPGGGTHVAWSQTGQPPLCSAGNTSVATATMAPMEMRTSAFLPVPGKIPAPASVDTGRIQQPQPLQAGLTPQYSMPQVVGSQSVMAGSYPQSVMMIPSSGVMPASPTTAAIGYSTLPMSSQYPPTVPMVQPQQAPASPVRTVNRSPIGTSSPTLQPQPVSPRQQKYKVIQVVVPARIANQVLASNKKYQLIPAPPEATAVNAPSPNHSPMMAPTPPTVAVPRPYCGLAPQPQSSLPGVQMLQTVVHPSAASVPQAAPALPLAQSVLGGPAAQIPLQQTQFSVPHGAVLLPVYTM